MMNKYYIHAKIIMLPACKTIPIMVPNSCYYQHLHAICFGWFPYYTWCSLCLSYSFLSWEFDTTTSGLMWHLIIKTWSIFFWSFSMFSHAWLLNRLHINGKWFGWQWHFFHLNTVADYDWLLCNHSIVCICVPINFTRIENIFTMCVLQISFWAGNSS